MNSFLRSFFVILLSGLVLLGGSGFTIGKMVCLCSGKTTVKLEPVGLCCDDDGCCENTIENSCCDISNYSYEAGNYTPGQIVHTGSISEFSLPAYTFIFDFFTPAVHETGFFFSDPSPPPGGKIIRHRLGSLII